MCNTDILSCFIQQMKHQGYITLQDTQWWLQRVRNWNSVSFHLQLLKNLMWEGKVFLSAFILVPTKKKTVHSTDCLTSKCFKKNLCWPHSSIRTSTSLFHNNGYQRKKKKPSMLNDRHIGTAYHTRLLICKGCKCPQTPAIFQSITKMPCKRNFLVNDTSSSEAMTI